MSNKKILVVYFSKTGEQYDVGNITEGNTAIVAKMIADYTGGDLFEVKLKNDTYPTAYKALTEVALSEKKENTRPQIDDDVTNFTDYNIVFVGSPNWWGDLPMALYTFMEAHDWNGKVVIPFVTHGGGGADRSFTDTAKLCEGCNVNTEGWSGYESFTLGLKKWAKKSLEKATK